MSETFYPRISIVTPSYNQGSFLEETIISVLNQNYPDLEYIIIDGGSTDNSIEIIKRYEHHLAYWVSEKDKGQSDAINKGFKMASGDILAWLNSDDQYYPGVLFKVVEYFQKSSAELLYGYNNDIDSKGNVIRKGIFIPFNKYAFKTGFAICQPASFWRKEVWKTCEPLDTGLNFCMDYDFYSRALTHNYKFLSIPVLICKFRYHTENKSTVSKSGFKTESRIVQTNYFPEIYKSMFKIFLAGLTYFLLTGTKRIIRIFK